MTPDLSPDFVSDFSPYASRLTLRLTHYALTNPSSPGGVQREGGRLCGQEDPGREVGHRRGRCC